MKYPFVKVVRSLPKYKIQSIAIGDVLPLLSVDFDYYRVVNRFFEPVLYPKKMFDPINLMPDGWVLKEFDDGEWHLYPLEFSSKGFFEKYFDGCTETIERYNKYMLKHGLYLYLKSNE